VKNRRNNDWQRADTSVCWPAVQATPHSTAPRPKYSLQETHIITDNYWNVPLSTMATDE